MKERIYTIPINEAFEKECECPICAFEKEEEAKLLEYFLGASMMEPDARQFTNEKGFCKHHYLKILDSNNKLSTALVTQTHLERIIDDLKKAQKNLPDGKRNLFKKSKDLKEEIKNQIKFLDNLYNDCALCVRLNHIMDVFMDNLLFLLSTEKDFYEKFFNTKGFCIKHFNSILKYAPKYFSGDNLFNFTQKLYKIETDNLIRVKEDLDWFIKKFDYRFKDADWKNSKDAVKRSIEKIVSYYE